MKVRKEGIITWIGAVIILSILQVSVREYFDFYSGDGFVSFLIGGWIGILAYPLMRLKFRPKK